ncbi:conserved hypothetical protein [Thiomonas sp. X19]|nr:conserved hypothetical protein [Thiomonas sp. X19]
MRRKIHCTDEPLGEVRIIPDFLPPPAQLGLRDEGVKVTLALSKKSVEFFKLEAPRNHTQYQRMIRHLLDAYVDRHSAAIPTQSPRKSMAKSGAVKSN